MNQGRLRSILDKLNVGQSAAVDRIAGGWQTQDGHVRLTIVDGPPGTGKTHVAAAAAGRWVMDRRGRVVVLSPTHAAAERVRDKMLDVGFDGQQVLRLQPGNPRYDSQRGVLFLDRPESLPPNLRRLLQQTDVLITTWHASQRAFKAASNFLLLVDEVSQVSFAAFLSILRRAYQQRPAGYALLGDPQQLPVISTQEVLATNAALGVLRRHPDCEPCRLELQYRMNGPICRVVNEVRRRGFGGVPLLPGSDAVAARTLDRVAPQYSWQSSRFADILNPRFPVVLVDTSRFAKDCDARERGVGTSWEYEAEARLAMELAKAVKAACAGMDEEVVAVSSPYSAQVALMTRLGAPNAITIYRAQGHEWDCVILSLGRTMGRTIMDELFQNVYVGLSRARSKLIVLLNRDLFGPYRILGSVFELAGKEAGIHTVLADPNWVAT
jgi:hypothetical protein